MDRSFSVEDAAEANAWEFFEDELGALPEGSPAADRLRRIQKIRPVL